MTEVTRLPVPTKLEPKSAKRTLMMSVRSYFYTLYNADSDKFRELLGSVGNKDAVTGNRYFDRHEAVKMIKEAAIKAQDDSTVEALDGDVYRCLVNVMRGHAELSLKWRRQQYLQFTQQAAE
jgi:hypothetical protein